MCHSEGPGSSVALHMCHSRTWACTSVAASSADRAGIASSCRMIRRLATSRDTFCGFPASVGSARGAKGAGAAVSDARLKSAERLMGW
eukprot:740870-Prorocentrum_minimum.AAC.1